MAVPVRVAVLVVATVAAEQILEPVHPELAVQARQEEALV